MSYTYLQDQEAESSAECFSDIPASVLSRLNLTADKSCCNGNETESCHDSPSGTTCEHSTENHGEDSLTLCAEAGHAPTLAPQAQCSELKGRTLDYGLNLHASQARYCRQSSSWKTRQLSLFSGLDEFSEAFPNWGTMRNGEFWEAQKPTWIATEKGSGYLRRPMAKDGKGFYIVTMDSTLKRIANKDRQIMLIHQVFLNAYASMKVAVANPPFWESLMDWPIGWTDLKPLDLAKFQQWLRSHGAP